MKVSKSPVLAITFVVIANTVHAQPLEKVWDKVFDSGYQDTPYSLVVYDTDYVMVGGSSSNGTDFDWRIIKYDLDGNEIWNKVFDTGENEGCKAVLPVPDTDAFCATGPHYNGSNYDFRIAKFDEEGEEIWSNVYDGGYDDWAHDVVAPDTDRLLVGGDSYNGSDYDFCWVEYDADGNEIWHKTFDSGYDDGLVDMDILNDTGICITGYSYNGSNFDFATMVVDTNGNVVWNETYDSGRDDFGYGVTAFIPMYVYVAGASDNGTDMDWKLLKYDDKGNLIWEQEYDSGKDDFPYGLAVDTGGYLYVAGCSKDENNSDFSIAKYTPDGKFLWNMIYDSGGDEAKYTADIVVDKKTGFVYVTFDYIPSSGYLTAGDDDFRTIKYRQFLTVYGSIKENGSGMENVMVVLSGSGSDTTYTDEDGNYEFSDLPCGEDYTITPHKEGYTFSPPNYTYSPLNSDKPDQNFEGTFGIAEKETKFEDFNVSQKKNRIIVRYNLNKNGRVNIKLLNSLGSVIDGMERYEVAGEHTCTFNIPVSGIYFIKINVDKKNKIKKLVITN